MTRQFSNKLLLQEGDTDDMSDDGESSQTEEMIPNESQQSSPSVAIVHPHRISNYKPDISRLVLKFGLWKTV